MTNNGTPTSPTKMSLASSLKQAPCKASSPRKFRRSSSLQTESWRLASIEEVRKAQERVLGYKRQQAMAPADRAKRCQNLVNAALSALNSGEQEMCDVSTRSCPPTATATPSAESLYGYNELPTLPSINKPKTQRRRFQRRCSVTEFSLKAAVLAKVQLSREAKGACL